MQIVIRGRGVDPSARFRSAVEHRLSRIDRFGVPVDTVDVEVTLEPKQQRMTRALPLSARPITLRSGYADTLNGGGCLRVASNFLLRPYLPT